MPRHALARIRPQSIRVIALTLVVLVTTGIPATAAAQSQVALTTQQLVGVVQDSRGLPLLGAFVAVIALGDDQPAAIVVTDVTGGFEVKNLPSGVYALLVGSLGFAGTMMQGLNVPGTAPLTLQLEADPSRSLSAFSAPLDMSWALRSKKRDVLRQTDGTIVVDAGTDAATPTYTAAQTDGVVRGISAVSGELRLWSVTNVSNAETIGVTSLSLGTPESWSLRAHVDGSGALWAASDVTRKLGDHELQVGFGYVGGTFDLLGPTHRGYAPGDAWIGRLDVRDTWRISRPLSVSVGARYEHQNYLAESALVSPSVEVTYQPSELTRISAGATQSSTGVGLADDQGFEVLSLLRQAELRIGNTSRVQPERSRRYHVEVEQRVGPAAVSARAYFDDVTDELLGVFVSGPGGVGNYLLFNVGDSSAAGFELAVAGELLDTLTGNVSGEVSYAVRGRDTPYSFRAPGQLVASLPEIDSSSVQRTHEMQASVAAELAPSRTYFQASYNWRSGMPVVQEGDVRYDFGRLDLRLRQPLPFRSARAEWSAMVQVRNLLGPTYDRLYNVSLAELVGLTRGIAGGLAVRF